MSNKNLQSDEEVKTTKLVGADGEELEMEEKENLRFTPNPSDIFAVQAEAKKTPNGIYLPDSAKSDKAKTPIAKVLAVGELVNKHLAGDYEGEVDFTIEEGDFVYLKPHFMNFGQVDGIDGIITQANGILGKVTEADG